ncbi:helix-turn-helix transcriptional regulator [Streptomyces sp. NBC_00568]|uniref:helix-turn-helix domain-containing protein n=1 Tax=Streptomyces sp. NBC_00568 TaxID=2975779 RepID=UPI00225703E5|nr:helix-turn-helix transcriptional regulator [Streptomyces sp. NBC_00568]MCX4993773.1 helix-turn-helix transcriptional regulator [Streptomyces sp. NBC_00568]
MRWELRLRAAERGVFKAVEMRRLLAQAGLRISAGKMSALWSTTVAPVSIRLDDLEVLCRVLRCDPAGLLVLEQPPDPLAGGWITAAAPPDMAGPHPAGEGAPPGTEDAGWSGQAGTVRSSLPLL